MKARTQSRRWAAAAIGAVAVGALAVGTSPASASASSGYLSGAGSIYDDFGDEGTLSVSSYSHSTLACFWQNVLYAEGARESDDSKFDKSDIDGQFGPNTRFATRTLQYRWGLTADGLVGGNTFGKLDAKRTYLPDVDGGVWTGKLQYLRTNTPGNDAIVARYHGKDHSFSLTRGASGRWLFENLRTGTHRTVAYNRNDC
ncbi:peptidoglycan-binding protein [Streptomyces sp. CHD11]|uniref:peptidoglycan-binding domain-containing protein n=1 Tax=Streptomyces sp. CHD11 TaxID=2741325 RepID=UPI001BFCC80A|nr:peptidoglycan-binding domain-containing protein [Streptomyces sp. CHD11]MBT3155206.1 peptidoglycan-binding protein [Streptomyces sp. CHD11]